MRKGRRRKESVGKSVAKTEETQIIFSGGGESTTVQCGRDVKLGRGKGGAITN